MTTPTEQPPICFACQQPMQTDKEHVCRERKQPPVDLEGLRELYAKATPGPWTVSHHPTGNASFIQIPADGWDVASVTHFRNEDAKITAELIKDLHNAFPAIYHEITTARQRIGGLEAERKTLRTYIGLADKEKVISAEPNSMLIERESTRVRISPAPVTSQAATIERMRIILQSAKCQKCEGLGYYIVLNKNTGEPEQSQCEWCHYRDEALALTQPPQGEEVRKDGWQPIETAPKGKKVIAGYWNQLGKWRTVMARYYLPMTLPSTDDLASEPGCNYMPEGWYEESETHEEIHKVERPPVLWQPLPAAPSTSEAEGAGS